MAFEFVALKLAEAAISHTVETISDLLAHEASSLRSVKDDIESLRTELTRIQCFLEDADQKQEHDRRMQNWINEVQEISGEIEDVIQTYIFNARSSFLRKAFRLRELGISIRSVKEKLKSIGKSRQRYQIEFSKGEGMKSFDLRSRRRTYPDDEEHNVITLKEPTTNLKKKLREEEDQLRIVSIVGMGGLGKTTLAKRVYNDAEVKNCFDCRVWVYISQQYVLREVLTEILLQVDFDMSNKLEGRELRREKNIKETLGESITKREFLKCLQDRELDTLMETELQNKRYLIVLDDIWDIKAWNGVKNALPNGKSGSKVLFTTRIEAVASSADSDSSIIKLPLLTSDESLQLLKRIVFPRETFMECDYPSDFEKLGKEMLKKCGGLPLAIVILGGLLIKKNSKEGWEEVLGDVEKSPSMINRLESHQEYRVEDILDLSFQDLPYYLKPCFLYMGIFPEDCEIHKSMLVRLWIAEGFVSRLKRKEANESMEDIAEQCLEELIDRCMVQVDKKNLLGTRVKTCRLHDLMRDFCISKAKKENVFDIIDEDQMKKSRSLSIEYQVTHLSRRIVVPVNRGLDVFPLTEQVPPRISSFLLFGIDTFPTLSSRVKNFRLLKVLSLDFLEKSSIPNKSLRGIGTLLLLRYLRLNICSYRLIIPNSIGNLQNLQTLDIRGGLYKVRIAQSLARLIHLRHLLLPYFRYNPRMIRSPLFGMFSLTNIETLKGIRPEDLIVNGKVISLVNIRKFNMDNSEEEEKVRMVVESLSHCHYLTSLSLRGNVSTTNFSFLPNSLLKLKLNFSQVNEAIFTDLQKLPNLRLLKLSYVRCFDGSDSYKFVCSTDGFPKLEILVLSELIGLKEWEVEENAMPNLKRLDINYLTDLKMIPEGLKNVTTLRELNIRGMRKEFEKRLRRVNEEDGTEGEDYYKVSHVPTITISDTRY